MRVHDNLEHREIILAELSLQVGTETFIGCCKLVESRAKCIEEWVSGFGRRWCQVVALFDRWQCRDGHVVSHVGRHRAMRV